MVCQFPTMQSKDCYGQYENEQGKCGGCPLALLCIDATIAADGYYDELARKNKEEAWAEETLLMDAAIQAAKAR